MSRRTSRSRNPDIASAQIFNAAIEEFAAYGVRGARVEGIARRSQYDKRLVSHYFGTKEELYRAVVEHHVARLGDVIDAVPDDLEPQDAIAEFIRRYIQFLADNPGHTRLVIHEELTNEAVGINAGLEVRTTIFARLSGWARDAQQAGILREAVDPTRAVISILGVCFHPFALKNSLAGRVEPWITEQDGVDAHIAHVTDFIRAALLGPAPRRRTASKV